MVPTDFQPADDIGPQVILQRARQREDFVQRIGTASRYRLAFAAGNAIGTESANAPKVPSAYSTRPLRVSLSVSLYEA